MTSIKITLDEILTMENVPLEFIMNLDEMGQQNFADAETKTVIFPSDYQQSFAPYPIEPKGDRSTVLACINANDVVCRPLFAVNRAFVDLEVYRRTESKVVFSLKRYFAYKNPLSKLQIFKSLEYAKKSIQCTRKSCRQSYSVLDGTFFQKCKLKLNTVLFLRYNWLLRVLVTSAINLCGVCDQTACDYYKYFGNLVADLVADHQEKIGDLTS